MKRQINWQLFKTRLHEFFSRLPCKIGLHGEPIGTCEVVVYDVHKRIFRIRNFYICPACKKEVSN